MSRATAASLPSPELTDNQRAIRRAIEWVKIASNQLELGRKVLTAQGYGDDVNPIKHAIAECLDVIRELETQYKR